MSAKWIRSKQWDDQNIPGWAWPVKAILRTFSSIWLAVCLLSLVVLYAVLASVPAGLIVLGLTYLVYGGTLVVTVALIAGAPVLLMDRLWPAGRARATRFLATLLVGLSLAALAAQAWHLFAWPRLMYDPARGTGLRLFASFVEQYQATTLRRLPGFEMSELEFYSWWPLRVVLMLFVLNLVTATVRRIEFTFPNLGVLTVHTGIITIALGSVYYKGLKQEGDTLLIAGEPGPDGELSPGRPEAGFYDNTRVVLWAREGDNQWEQRPIRAPRYNEYGLGAAAEGRPTVLGAIGRTEGDDHGRVLDRPVPAWDPATTKISQDVTFRIVGYAPYAAADERTGRAASVMDWARAEVPAGRTANPVRFCELIARPGEGEDAHRAGFFFLPALPSQRLGETEAFGLEYTRGMSAQRLADLTAELPPGTAHALVVEIPAGAGSNQAAFRGVFAVEPGKEIRVGETGYTLTVKQLEPEPPFPIITEGYRGATSSVAIVRVTPPLPSGAAPDARPAAYERWVYHRFPEISQDMLDELNERGMPKRRDADAGIRIAYIDASKLQMYLDEGAGAGEAAPVRAIIRQPGGAVRVVEGVQPGGTITGLLPPPGALEVRLAERWPHAEPIERPSIVPEKERKASDVGTHENAVLGVEVRAAGGFKRVVWLPYTKYLAAGMGTERAIELPDGRHISLAFGRLRYPLPGFFVQLLDFQMLAYDHRGSPRDYQSRVRVVPVHDGAAPPSFRAYEHITKLNAPLQAPFMWSDDRAYLSNLAGTLASRLSPRQFKFSQAGWDAQMWQESQHLVDEGKLARPYVRFTILGVGNNPGIHIVALGAILMSVGIPWAFYVKPLIMRRRRAKLAAQVAAGTYHKPESRPMPAAAPVGADA